MFKYLAFSIFAALFYAGQSLADAVNYNYVELGYVDADIDTSGIDEDGDGYRLNASAEVSEELALVLGYEDIEYDSDVDGTLLKLGIAYHKPYSPTGDVVLGLAYIDADVDAPGGRSIDDSGNEISLEIRGRTSDKTEVHLGLLRREIDDSSSGFLFRIITGNPQGYQFVVDYEDLDDTSALMLGVRRSF